MYLDWQTFKVFYLQIHYINSTYYSLFTVDARVTKRYKVYYETIETAHVALHMARSP